MSIFVNKNTRLLVQGITGKEGQFHTRQCVAYGTKVVAGVTPGKAGQKMDDIPVFHTVKDAVKATGANCSMIFVPPPFAADAIMEAADAGVELIVAITEGIPVMDMMRVKNFSPANPAASSAPTVRESSPRASARSASCRARFISPEDPSAWFPVPGP